MNFKPVTHVIFDLDGTILDTETVYFKVIDEICKSYGGEYTDELHGKVLGTREPDTVRIIMQALGIEEKISHEDFLKDYLTRSKAVLRGIPLMPGARKIIEHLHKHKIPYALATSSSIETVKIKIEHVKDLFDTFSHMVMGSSDPEVKNGKPAPDIYLICASRFSPPAEPQKCLVFEDAPNGVIGSLKANMQVVALRDPSVSKDLFPKETTLMVDSLEEFKPELFGLPAYD